jgi:hypothetical protein
MGWTKRQFIEQAFDEIGLASYVFDLPPEQLNSALRKMDTMIATWNTAGVRLGYPLPSAADGSDLDQDSGVPDSANEAIYLNLAIRLGPSLGKAIAMETKVNAKNAYDTLLGLSAMPVEMQLPVMPTGAGNKPILRRYTPSPIDPILAGQDGPIEFD